VLHHCHVVIISLLSHSSEGSLAVTSAISVTSDQCWTSDVVPLSFAVSHTFCACVLQNAMSSADTGGNPLQVVQYILYESDSVQVTYADGTCIQLSPCGTTFVCQQPLSVDSQHPINGTYVGLIDLLLVTDAMIFWLSK